MVDPALANAELLPEGWRVTLPNEPEWEKAARGGLEVHRIPSTAIVAEIFTEHNSRTNAMQNNAEPQRRYPWGNEISSECINYGMKIGGVSIPGVYPKGVSPYGCHDLAGNAWEWTRSELGDYPYPAVGTAAWKQRERENPAVCVLRGGAFNNNHNNVRCAVRINNEPDNRNNNIGFRVVLSTLITRNERSLLASAPRLMAGYFPGRARIGRANSNDPFPCLSGLGPLYE